MAAAGGGQVCGVNGTARVRMFKGECKCVLDLVPGDEVATMALPQRRAIVKKVQKMGTVECVRIGRLLVARGNKIVYGFKVVDPEEHHSSDGITAAEVYAIQLSETHTACIDSVWCLTAGHAECPFPDGFEKIE